MGALEADGMRTFCARIMEPQTDVRRVRDGLHIAMDGLSQSDRDRHFRRVLLAMHWLLDEAISQADIAANAEDMRECAEWLADYHGAADAGSEHWVDEWRDRQ